MRRHMVKAWTVWCMVRDGLWMVTRRHRHDWITAATPATGGNQQASCRTCGRLDITRGAA